MSRLDSAIRRLTAQRACIEQAIALVADLPGPVLELGLGNGRTYDHLRSHIDNREIFVFEREVMAHPDSIPDDAHLIVGNWQDTLPGALALIGAPVALAHCDIGSGDAAANAALAAWLAPVLVPLLAAGAVVASDQRLAAAELEDLPLPVGVNPGRYQISRKKFG